MIVFLNGQFVPEEQAVVSIFDRSFLYGDGLFETLRVYQGKPFRWAEHIERLRTGAAFLKVKLPFPETELREHALRLIERNRMPEALLRISLSRGIGVRGYSPKGADRPTIVMSLSPAPEETEQPRGWRVVTSSFRLPANEPLAQFKTCNKLPQILARAEADAAGADEALLLNTRDEAVEGSSSNLFWIQDGVVCTPPLASGILAGVTRTVVMEICGKLGLPTREGNIGVNTFWTVQGVFLSLSSRGVVEIVALDGRELEQSPLVKKIQHAYQQMIWDWSANGKSRYP